MEQPSIKEDTPSRQIAYSPSLIVLGIFMTLVVLFILFTIAELADYIVISQDIEEYGESAKFTLKDAIHIIILGLLELISVFTLTFSGIQIIHQRKYENSEIIINWRLLVVVLLYISTLIFE